MATMTRGNQKIQVADKKIQDFVSRGWVVEGQAVPKPTPTTKKPTNSKRIKPVEAVVEQQPTIDDEEHDFLQQNQGFIDDNLNNQEGEN